MESITPSPEPEVIEIEDDLPVLSPLPSFTTQQDDIKQRIEVILNYIIEDVSNSRAPYLEIRTPLDTQVPLKKLELISRKSQLTFTKVISLIIKCYELINRGERQNKRDIFYENIRLYQNERKLDYYIKIVCALLNAPRWDLNIEASAKGLIAGSLQWKDEFNCIQQVSTIVPSLIPSNQTGFHDFKSDARFILIVEKDAVFRKIMEEECFQALGPFLLLTGKGYPDYATRRFLRKLCDSLQLPTFILVDADPHGLQIAVTYRWGTIGCIDPELCTSVELLGLLPSELDFLSLNQRLAMTDREVLRLDRLENRMPDEDWKREVQVLRTTRTKAEIENLTTSSPNFLTQVYLLSKITRRLNLSPNNSQVDFPFRQ